MKDNKIQGKLDSKQQWAIDRTFEPSDDHDRIQKLKAGWADAVGRTLSNRQ